jgi:CubicO group peptidase (beta-lactamase class C family)
MTGKLINRPGPGSVLGFILSMCLVLMAVPAESARAAEQAEPPRSLAGLESQIVEIMERDELVGAVAAIVEDGRLVWSKGFGVADKATGRLALAGTPFRAGSISKTFIALALMSLEEDGKLSLDDKLSDLAPEIGIINPFEETHPIRLVHLVEHTSGIDDLHFTEFVINDPNITLAEALAITSKSRISRWPPGSIYSYSNSGPIIAAYIIEKVTGLSFDNYVRAQFLAPLGMERTTFRLDNRVKGDLSKSYGNNGLIPVPYRHILGPPAGGMNTTVGDLAKLMTLYLNRGEVGGRRLLSEASIVRTEQPKSSLAAKLGQSNGYAMGNHRRHAFGQVFHGHLGGIDGFAGEFGYIRGPNRGYVMILNTPDVKGYRDIRDLLQGYVARDLAPLVADEAVRDEADLASHEGYYLARSLRFEFMRVATRLGPGIRKIKLENGELVMSRLLGGNPRRLIPEAGGGFRFDKDMGPTVYFADEGGEHQLLGEYSFTRISAVVAWLIPVLVFSAVLIMLSSGLYGLIWIPKAILRKYPGRQAVLLRLWPLAASLTLIGGVASLVNLFGAPYPDIIFDALARPGPVSVGFFLSTLAFPALAIAGLVTCWRTSPSVAGPLARGYAALVSGALLILAIYLANYGWLGMQTWNY